MAGNPIEELLRREGENYDEDCPHCRNADRVADRYLSGADEIARLQRELDAERAKRCGTCADAVIHNLVTKVYGCRSKTSACAGPKCDWREWPADHGCPCWRQREAPHA